VVAKTQYGRQLIRQRGADKKNRKERKNVETRKTEEKLSELLGKEQEIATAQAQPEKDPE